MVEAPIECTWGYSSHVRIHLFNEVGDPRTIAEFAPRASQREKLQVEQAVSAARVHIVSPPFAAVAHVRLLSCLLRLAALQATCTA
eukprot:2961169-Amphidinium_carterae.1